MLGHEALENQSLENVTATSHRIQEEDEMCLDESITQCDKVKEVETAFGLHDESRVICDSEKSEPKTDEGGLESETECMITV